MSSFLSVEKKLSATALSSKRRGCPSRLHADVARGLAEREADVLAALV
jgi:hypothetical protein